MDRNAEFSLDASSVSFEDGLEKIYDEISLASLWHKPAYLVVVFRHTDERVIAGENLAKRFSGQGYSVLHIDGCKMGFCDFREKLLEDVEPQRTVYFINNLDFESRLPDKNFWQLFYEQRENLDEKMPRVIFWINEKQFADAALTSPSYWENRYQVVDLNIESGLIGDVGISEGDATEVCAKHRLVSNSELSENLLSEINANLEAGILDWRHGELGSGYQQLRNALDLANVLEDKTMQINCYKGLALVLTSMNNFAEAIDAYNKILELDSHSSVPWNSLGNLYGRLSDYQKSAEMYNTALAYNPTNVVSWLGLADVYEKTRIFQQAIDSYREALKIAPDLQLAWFRLGAVLEELNQERNAIRAYEILVSRFPDHAPAWLRMAKLHAKLGEGKKALQIAKTALEHSPASFELWVCLANLSEDIDSNLAVEAYRKSLAIDPRHGETYCRLARTHARQGNMLDAIRCYELGIDFLDNDAERSRALSDLMSILGKTEVVPFLSFTKENSQASGSSLGQSEKVFNAASESAMDVRKVSNASKAVEEPDDKYEAGMGAVVPLHLVQDVLEVPLKLEQRFESVRGQKLEESSEIYAPEWYLDREKFAKSLRMACKVSPTRSEYEQIKLLSDSNLEKPVSDFWKPRKKTRQKLVSVDVAGTLAQDELETENYLPESIFGAKTFLSPWTDDRAVRSWLRQGKHLLKHGLYQDAIESFKTVTDIEPECGTAYISMGVAYFFLGKYDQALMQLYKGLEFTRADDEKSLAWNHIGDAYRRLHDSENALRAYQKVSSAKKPETVLRQRARRVLLFGNC
ncbi:MAG: tetratricopeptide repeat protein [Anaerolineales bacterium]